MIVRTFSYTGGMQSFVTPAGVTEIVADLVGAPGGETITGRGGKGERVVATFPAVTGQTIYVFVGQTGSMVLGSAIGRPAKFNGGGGSNNVSSGGFSGGSGGGACDIRIGGTGLGNRVLVAGGGGAQSGGSHSGGDGGTNTGEDGADGVTPTTGGGGGGTAAGGAAGVGGVSGGGGVAGVSGQGGRGGGASGAQPRGGGGGGGGHYGGGGGGGDDTVGSGGGGGGGSGFVAATINGSAPTSVTNVRGYGGPAYITLSYNLPPNQPTLNTPISGSNIDPALALDFSFTFSDADPLDTCTSADLRYRVGAGTWTDVLGLSIAPLGGDRQYGFTIAATTFTPDTDSLVEWQLRTYDADGAVGPYSDSSYFTPRTAPGNATIAPAPVIDSFNPEVDWTTPAAMILYQVRFVNDVAGSPGTTVLADTGMVPVSGSPMAGAAVPPTYLYVSGTDYHAQVRYQQYPGVWSNWQDSGPITADINAPLAPTAVLVENNDTASVLITITNPGSDPFPPDHNDIYRTNLDDPDAQEIRIASGVSVNGSFIDYFPGNLILYRYRVVAVTPSGAFASSV